jgi:hypothetical protein
MKTIEYQTYRAVGRPMLFKGFSAQYIVLAALSLVTDLLLFVILYCCGVTPWFCVVLAFGLGAASLGTAATLSKRFGANGLMKLLAGKKLPEHIRCSSRRFFHLQNYYYEIYSNPEDLAHTRGQQ